MNKLEELKKAEIAAAWQAAQDVRVAWDAAEDAYKVAVEGGSAARAVWKTAWNTAYDAWDAYEAALEDNIIKQEVM